MSSTITVQLDDRLLRFVERQASGLGLGSPERYVESLLAREERKLADIAELESALRSGLNSGAEFEVNEHFWEKKRSDLLARHRH